MRLGLFSSLAALLAGSSLAIGQTPETFVVPAQVVPGPAVKTAPQQAKRGLLQPVSYTTAMQPPAGASVPAPVPVVVGQPAPLDVTTAPLVPEMTEAPIYESHMYRAWGKAEYILWRFGSVLLPEFQADVAAGNAVVFSRLVTITNGIPGPGDPIDTAFNIPVSVTVNVGTPGAQSIDLRDQPGFRVTAGWWVDSSQEWGWEASYFWLWNRDVGLTNSLNLVGQTVQLPEEFDQSRTIITTTGLETSEETITSPLFLAADVNTLLQARATNQVWGVEINGRRRLAYFGPAVFDLIGGVRFIKIKQEASVLQNITLSPTAGVGQGAFTVNADGSITPPDIEDTEVYPSTATLLATVSTTLFDKIAVQNDYYLAQIGGSFEWDVSERFFVCGFGKLGFGGVRQSASLVGLRTQTVTPADNVTINDPNFFGGLGGTGTNAAITGGLLVGPQDNGTEKTLDRIVFVPEANINFGWRATPGIRFMVGYNVIHFSNVAKVNNVTANAPVTTTVNFGEQRVSQNVLQPGFRIGGQKSSLQGISLAAEFRY